ncbi:hypothetical protein PFICI_00898 [Pestalotiopsis fici W106-1]|uniref:Oxidoreductase acuF-like C2H2 type zinc-finger domain-containing protein n=1 Tax=Pestalotiopsis fici (strain W106-1 / CGMCC3.15140) TaxID=1229662 RepID=W3XM75_PESFW|nr:uncharacterized protein PFICI_00898 [Pestalotiopsis fici W106-1]ETS87070.1 hypothetical protein PFICI_00898 [Pestalotiopsis fici W106-1]
MARHLRDIGTTLLDRFLFLMSKESTGFAIDRLESHIQNLKTLLDMVQSSYDDDSDTSDFNYDSYSEIAEDLKTDTTCLIRINSVLNYTARLAPSFGTSPRGPTALGELYQSYCDRISNRFPNAVECLISRLGKANYDRCLRRIQRNNEDDEEPKETERVQMANTVVVSAFHDSGLGSSVPSKSSYAETVMSYGADGNQQSVRVPTLSEEAKQGLPFTCVACSKTVTIKNNSLWKRHLYEDLCPWMCLDPECPSGDSVFSHRNDWLAHLSFKHQMAPAWASTQCPLCCSDIESGKTSITRHLGNHLEEIALGSLSTQTELDNDNDEDSQTSISHEGSTEDSIGKLNLTDPGGSLQIEEPPPVTLENQSGDDIFHDSQPPLKSDRAESHGQSQDTEQLNVTDEGTAYMHYGGGGGPSSDSESEYDSDGPPSPPPPPEEETFHCCECDEERTFSTSYDGEWVCNSCGKVKCSMCGD